MAAAASWAAAGNTYAPPAITLARAAVTAAYFAALIALMDACFIASSLFSKLPNLHDTDISITDSPLCDLNDASAGTEQPDLGRPTGATLRTTVAHSVAEARAETTRMKDLILERG